MNTFKYYREANGYTQEDLANILNISRQAISKWENSKCLPDIENLIILCSLYKISIENILLTDQETLLSVDIVLSRNQSNIDTKNSSR
ncbi:helix-turn-helix domain-containing protein [Enterococcus casseliflavus]|uniref:helix-turn-helix transcriptional regulator n=1 Tax=Enterococcus casseliflavus TaxID=37734 RepID=UPI002DBA0A40|nr:helix-turn-helix transcriptional regulator [Enterococcus casseliflavus]MEB8418526.1 helix-turn-helix domain-containing protein [Enterococcus casseliflavus]